MLSEKIVVIDDDKRVIDSVKIIFMEYDILSFNNGEKALEYLKNPNETKLVLLDVMMPGMDGISVLKEIKKYNKNIAVIIMTGFASQEVAVQALRQHADDFIEKPFDVTDIKEKVKNLLKEQANFDKCIHDKDEQVQRIKNFIERNYSNASLEFIAKEMSLSPKYVSRMFSHKSDEGFRDYKVKIKMEKARSLLESTRLNIAEISRQLGYQNSESFMRIFKRVMNVTPTQYRKNHQTQKVAAQ